MKRIVALLLLLLFLLSFFVSCEEKEDDTDDGTVEGCWDNKEGFYNFEAFEEYASHPQNQTDRSKIDKNTLVNLDSIIPNEEIGRIWSYNDSYEVWYNNIENAPRGFLFSVSYNSTYESIKNATYCEEPIENTDISQEGRYVFNVNGTDVYYNVNKYGVCQFITFRLSNYEFSLVEVNRIILSQNTTEAQKAFINAFMTEAGTADMLDRIADLIPGYEKPIAEISLEDAQKIKEGMTYSEIKDILGIAGTDVGSGAIIFEWKISGGEYLRVWFDPLSDNGESDDIDALIAGNVIIAAQ